MGLAIHNIEICRDLASLFSRSKVLEWMAGDISSISNVTKIHSARGINLSAKTYLEYLRKAYSLLVSQYQNEYVYKNELLNNSLIDEIATSDAKIINELRVGKSVADIAVFNGISKAFEIKTELDSRKRLATQLPDYFDVFNEVYLLVPMSQMEDYLAVAPQLGIVGFALTDGKTNLSLSRKAKTSTELSTNKVMSVLRSQEYLNIVSDHYGALPEMTSFTQFRTCSALIAEIPPERLNELFIAQLKARDQHNILSKRYHKELNQLFLALNLNRSQKEKLISHLKQPMN